MIFLWLWLLVLWVVLATMFVIKYREWKRWDKERRAELLRPNKPVVSRKSRR